MEYYEYHENQHLIACLAANLIAQMIIKYMPQGDLNDELQTILNEQFEILRAHLEGEHYGTKSIDQFLEHLEDVRKNLEEIQKCR